MKFTNFIVKKKNYSGYNIIRKVQIHDFIYVFYNVQELSEQWFRKDGGLNCFWVFMLHVYMPLIIKI